MKKLFALFFATALLLAGCSGGLKLSDTAATPAADESAYPFKTAESVYAKGAERVIATLTNATGASCNFGMDFSLEKSEDGVWRTVSFQKGQDAFNAIAQILAPGESAELVFELTRFPALPEGDYRIAKEIHGTQSGFVFAPFTIGEAPGSAQAVQLPNPLVEVKDASAFQKLRLALDAPEGAGSVRYVVISDEIAQVSFMLGDRTYTYRAAHSEEDISGVYETFDEKELGVCSDEGLPAIRIRLIDRGEGGALATWQIATAQFSLYTADPTDGDTITELALLLAKAAAASNPTEG